MLKYHVVEYRGHQHVRGIVTPSFETAQQFAEDYLHKPWYPGTHVVMQAVEGDTSLFVLAPLPLEEPAPSV